MMETLITYHKILSFLSIWIILNKPTLCNITNKHWRRYGIMAIKDIHIDIWIQAIQCKFLDLLVLIFPEHEWTRFTFLLKLNPLAFNIIRPVFGSDLVIWPFFRICVIWSNDSNDSQMTSCHLSIMWSVIPACIMLDFDDRKS